MNANVAPCVVDVWSLQTSSPRQLEKRWHVVICSRLVSIAPSGQKNQSVQVEHSLVKADRGGQKSLLLWKENQLHLLGWERDRPADRQHCNKPVTQLSFHSMQISSLCSLLCQHYRASAALSGAACTSDAPMRFSFWSLFWNFFMQMKLPLSLRCRKSKGCQGDGVSPSSGCFS